jgi:iron complex outermembrane recepter protein
VQFNQTMKLALAASSALTMFAAMPAMAQDAEAQAQAAEPAASDAGDIVVTARRMEESLQDVPISITVFNQAQLDNRNIVNSADLAIYTPSLSINNRFGAEKASFIIRGFVQDLATQPSVGVYFADVVAPRSGGSTTSGGGVGVGNMFDLQNVQVLKGPQGTLFGRNTTGGAVLLVPKKPTDQLEGYVEGSLGNYDMWRTQGVLNVPLADTFKVRLGIDRMKRDGYLKNHSGVGPDALGNVDYIAARLSIVAELTPDLENYTIANYSESDNNGITLRVLGCNTSPAPSVAVNAALACRQVARQEARGDGWWDIESNEPNARLRMETMQFINTTTYQANDNLTIKNIISYSEFRETTRMSLQGDYLLNANGTFNKALIRLNNTPGYNNSSQSTFTEELQFQGNSSDGTLTWQAGGYFENSNPIGFTSQSTAIGLNCPDLPTLSCNASPSANFDRVLGLPIPTVGNVFTNTVSRPFQKTWFRSRGLYAQATYNINEQFAVTGGLRYTWDKMTHRYDGQAIGFPATNTPLYFCSNTVRIRYPDGTSSPSNPGLPFPVNTNAFDHEACNVTFSAKSDKPTWLINLDYKPNDDILLYAKWARGYRAGGVASANIYYETWEPESVDTYEAGAKTSFRGSSVNGYFNTAVFYNDFSNQQIQATLQRSLSSPLLGGSAIVNAGKSTIWGIEADAGVTFFDIFKVEGGYTYLDAKLESLEESQFVLTPEQQLVWQAVIPTADPDVRGGRLAFSPEHRLTLTGTVMLPLDESIGDVSFGATYVYTSSQIGSTATAPQFQVLPSSNLLNLNANWNNIFGAPIDAAFFMTNVTNEKFPMAVANAWNSYGYESAIVNEPKMYGFRLKYRFGN